MSQAAAVAGWIVAIVGALATCLVAARRGAAVIAKLVRMADAFLGEPPSPSNPEGRLGLVARQEATEREMRTIREVQERQDTRLSFIEEQMKGNGANAAVETLRHTVDRVAQAVTDPPPDGSAAA